MEYPKSLLSKFLIRKLFLLSIIIVLGISLLNAQRNKFVVVLDAGHGGKDPGKISGGVKEKNLVLSFVLRVGKRLSKNKDIKVIYTRKTDVFVDLYKRGEIANKAKADLFVSVHCNAHNSSACGVETFILGLHANKQNFEVAKAENEVIFLEDNYEKKYEGFDINSPETIIGITITQEQFLEQSAKVATIIQQKLTLNLKRKDRGVKQAGFIVLHQTFMPSILIETGFITNRSERNFLNSFSGKNAISKEIAAGILSYKELVFIPPIEKDKIEKKELSKNNTQIQELEERGKIFDDIIFKIQILAARKKLELNDRNFKGLRPLSMSVEKNINRYYYGATSEYNTALKMKEQAINKGFKGAYIVAYKKNNRISVTDAIKKQNNNLK